VKQARCTALVYPAYQLIATGHENFFVTCYLRLTMKGVLPADKVCGFDYDVVGHCMMESMSCAQLFTV
jgi:hypothetical protein